MFVTIKYGADEERIVNPNVLSSVLLSHIRKSCGFEAITENLDLASENGEVVDLSSKGKEYAKKYLEPRNTYIVVKVVGDDSEENPQSYVPLLDNAADKMKFFISKARQGKGLKGGNIPATGKVEEAATGTGTGANKGKQEKQGANGKVDTQAGAKDAQAKANQKKK